MMASLVVACRTLLVFAAVLPHGSCVDGWRHRPPPSAPPSHRQRRPTRNLPFTIVHNPCMLRKSQSQLRRLVRIRGGEEGDARTENVVTSPPAASEKEHPPEQGPPPSSPSMGVPMDLPPKVPRLFLPKRPTPPDGEAPTSTGAGTATARPRRRAKVLILMDSFCEVHGQFLAERARDAYGAATLPVYSDYMRGYFLHLRPDDGPEDIGESLSMCMPSSEEEAGEWRSRLDDAFASMGVPGYELVALVCDSDSGLAHAEQLADWLNVTTRNPGGVRDERRDKYLMGETIRSAGIPSLRQRLCGSREEAVEFATTLLLAATSPTASSSYDGDDSDDGEDRSSVPPSCLGGGGGGGRNRVVVKPVRGVGSHDVYLCDDPDSVAVAFDRIHGSGVFGSPGRRHGAVLVQEFARGQEYAIDTVSRDGELKIVAVWKYDKRPANGAPFVYYATRLFDDSDDSGEEPICPALYAYLESCLQALDVRWGITHSEVIVTPDGPRLVEVNCRQHNMNFLLLTMGGIGYNSYDVLLAAFFGRDGGGDVAAASENITPIDGGDEEDRLEWDLIPHIPTTRMNAAMVHLVNSEDGTLKRANDEALHEIEAMASVVDMEVYGEFLEVGRRIRLTVDIKSDAGWIQLVHPDAEVFETDFRRIVELMPKLFEVESAPAGLDKY
jgi:hypothetical protein